MAVSSKYRVSAAKVGFLTIICLALLVFILIWLRGRSLSGGLQQDVLFKDIDGMREGAAVQMMGIRVGFVDQIEPIFKNGKYYVRVAFTINQDLGIEIPKGSRLSIEQSGLIGEKFLEISPPQLREVTLTTFTEPAKAINKGIPVKFLYEEGYREVGRVENVEQRRDGNLVRHRLYYRITLPGAEMPENPLYELTLNETGDYFLRILPTESVLVQAPDPDLRYTIENPLRVKRFMEIQMESAEALKVTNEKISELFSDETIETLHNTVKNTEVLTARANDVLESANQLFSTTRNDLSRMVAVSEQLAGDVSTVTNNLNDVLGDPQMKKDLIATVRSLNESSAALKDVLNDPALKETITLTRDTSRNTAELTAYIRKTVQDEELQQRLDRTMILMNTSLTQLSTVLTNLEEVTGDEDETLKGIVQDTRETAKNMKELSEKLNGRFALFKMMF